MSDERRQGESPDPAQRNGADPQLETGAEPSRGTGIVLLALTGAAVGASFVPGAFAGLSLAGALGFTAKAALGTTAAVLLIVALMAISLAVWVAGKLTGIDRRGRRFAWTVGGGEAGLVLGLLVAAIAGSLGAATMVMLAGLGAVLGDSIFLKRMKG